MSALDPRIGQLMCKGAIVHYAFLKGYNNPEFVGSLEEVEQELRLCPKQHVRAVAAELKKWNVKLIFQYPAWDEVDGIDYLGIVAKSKSNAIARARNQAEADGHAIGGRGRYWFTSTLNETKK